MMRYGYMLAATVMLGVGVAAWAAQEKRGVQPKNEAFEAIKGLAGTWENTKTAPGEKPAQLVFKVTAGGSAVIETMLPGTNYEMINMYTRDGENLWLVHYCAMGNQPRMKAVGIKDGVIKLEYVDGGNMKSRDESHMDSLELTIKGDTLVEKWTSYEKGKATGTEEFNLKRTK